MTDSFSKKAPFLVEKEEPVRYIDLRGFYADLVEELRRSDLETRQQINKTEQQIEATESKLLALVAKHFPDYDEEVASLVSEDPQTPLARHDVAERRIRLMKVEADLQTFKEKNGIKSRSELNKALAEAGRDHKEKGGLCKKAIDASAEYSEKNKKLLNAVKAYGNAYPEEFVVQGNLQKVLQPAVWWKRPFLFCTSKKYRMERAIMRQASNAVAKVVEILQKERELHEAMTKARSVRNKANERRGELEEKEKTFTIFENKRAEYIASLRPATLLPLLHSSVAKAIRNPAYAGRIMHNWAARDREKAGKLIARTDNLGRLKKYLEKQREIGAPVLATAESSATSLLRAIRNGHGARTMSVVPSRFSRQRAAIACNRSYMARNCEAYRGAAAHYTPRATENPSSCDGMNVWMWLYLMDGGAPAHGVDPAFARDVLEVDKGALEGQGLDPSAFEAPLSAPKDIMPDLQGMGAGDISALTGGAVDVAQMGDVGSLADAFAQASIDVGGFTLDVGNTLPDIGAGVIADLAPAVDAVSSIVDAVDSIDFDF